MVVPNGALALVPFEVLVTDSTTSPVYLLDQAPPIVYAPSAAALLYLVEKPSTSSAQLSVLTLGDADYGSGDNSDTASGGANRSRFLKSRGSLERLQFTATESNWVARVFSDGGAAVTQMRGADATEAKTREALAGKEIVHLACHGLVEPSFGNLFGALALTPSSRASVDPADDGFLTLAETFELDLKSCELAILSACETNLGPQQNGDGIWALSPAFWLRAPDGSLPATGLSTTRLPPALSVTFVAVSLSRNKVGKLSTMPTACTAPRNGSAISRNGRAPITGRPSFWSVRIERGISRCPCRPSRRLNGSPLPYFKSPIMLPAVASYFRLLSSSAPGGKHLAAQVATQFLQLVNLRRQRRLPGNPHQQARCLFVDRAVTAGGTRVAGAERRVRNVDPRGATIRISAVAPVTFRDRLCLRLVRFSSVRLPGYQLEICRGAVL